MIAKIFELLDAHERFIAGGKQQQPLTPAPPPLLFRYELASMTTFNAFFHTEGNINVMHDVPKLTEFFQL